MRTTVKHPLAATEIPFDFTKQLAKLSDTGTWYTILADPGIDVSVTQVVGGLYTVRVAGGENGTQYNYGLELLTSGGAVLVDTRRIRVQGVVLSGGAAEGGASGDDDTDVILDGGDANDDGVIIDGGTA